MKLSRTQAATLALACAGCYPAPGAAGSRGSRFSAQDAKVDALLAKMTLDEKVGQMTQADQQFLKEESDIETYHLGSLLSGGDSDPTTAGTARSAREAGAC